MDVALEMQAAEQEIRRTIAVCGTAAVNELLDSYNRKDASGKEVFVAVLVGRVTASALSAASAEKPKRAA